MKRRSTILFVDDDEELGETMMMTLDLMGYDARAETDPEEALSYFTIQRDRFDAAIIDYLMPGIDGLELARHLSILSPTLPIILITGYPGLIHPGIAESLHIDAILEKPFTPLELLQTLRDILPAHPRPKLTLVHRDAENDRM